MRGEPQFCDLFSELTEKVKVMSEVNCNFVIYFLLYLKYHNLKQ